MKEKGVERGMGKRGRGDAGKRESRRRGSRGGEGFNVRIQRKQPSHRIQMHHFVENNVACCSEIISRH